jgi:hypothetical protein
VHGEQAGRVRAHAEECRVPERHDAGVAEDEVERDGEQPGDQYLAAQHAVAWEQEERRDRRQPERDLDRAPAVGGKARFDGHPGALTPALSRPRERVPRSGG